MNDSAQLQEENQKLRQLLEDARERVAALSIENQLLRQKVDKLSHQLFGRSSEQLDPAQLQLVFDLLKLPVTSPDPDPTPETPVNAPRKRQSRKPRVRTPEDLEVVEEILLPPEVLAAPELWEEIGRETLDQLDFEPGRFFWRRTIRPKFKHRVDREQPPIIEPAPPRILDRGLAAPGLLTQILISRFADHIPYYRQQDIYFQRHGIWLPRQQMVQWTEAVASYLQGIWNCMHQEMLQSHYLQIDETPITCLDRDHPGGSRKGYLWVYLQPSVAVLYDWHPSRSAQCLEKFLGDKFSGRLQRDAYAAYDRYARDRENIILVGCWAHTRRKFFEASDQAPRVVGWILGQIQWLYAWEKEMRDSRAGPNLREAIRQQKSRLVIERLHRAFLRLQSRYLPASSLGKALSYALNQWGQLERVLEHGEVELDTNLVENAVRPTAVGKKNFLFIGHPEAGQRSAILYSLIQTCRMLDIDPYTYLKDVLERLPYMTNQTVEQLTPRRWKELLSRPALSEAA